MPSTALVATDFRAVEQRQGAAVPGQPSSRRSCARACPRADKLGAGVATRLPPVVAGVTQSFAVRIAFPVRVPTGKKTTTVALYFDEAGFAWGQAEVSFELQSTGVEPVTSFEKRSPRCSSRAPARRSAAERDLQRGVQATRPRWKTAAPCASRRT